MFKASASGKFVFYFLLLTASIVAYIKIYSADTAPFLSRQLRFIMAASFLSALMGVMRYNKLQQRDEIRSLMAVLTAFANIAIDVALFEYVLRIWICSKDAEPRLHNLAVELSDLSLKEKQG